MNVIDFMKATADFMAEDRPDLYTPESALDEMTQVMDALRAGDQNFNVIMFASYVFIRIVDEGMEDFLFSKKISGLMLDHLEEKVGVYGFTEDVNLPHVSQILHPDDLDDLD